MRGLPRLAWLLLAFTPAALAWNEPATNAKTLAPVILQLKWRHQFQFAGYYIAKEKGYYRDAGLEVTILPATPTTDPVTTVLEGGAHFGVAASELAMHRALGKPLVVLAVIFQHSPLAILARADRGIRNIHDLAGKRVMLAPQETEVFAYLRREQMPLEQLRVLPHSFQVEDLIDGKVDALAGYLTDEPYLLNKQKIPYVVLSPQSAGIDFYGDTLFTTEKYLAGHRDQAVEFRRASLRGWRYAMENIEETLALVHEHYAADLELEDLRFEARVMRGLIQADTVELGYNYLGRWRNIADTYSQLGLVPANASLQGFLFKSGKSVIPAWVYWSGAGGLVAILLCTGIIAYIVRLNRHLRGEIHAKERISTELNQANENLNKQLQENLLLQDQLRRDAIRDSLTSLYNRRYFEETLTRELARAERDNYSVGLVLLDVDYFKQINDNHGHQAGDSVLRNIGALLERQIRAGDIACRYGGEEFVVVLPNTPLEVACERAETWRRQFAEHLIPMENGDINVTFSVGVSAFPQHGQSLKTLFAAADKALYRAKHEGRNQLVAYTPDEWGQAAC